MDRYYLSTFPEPWDHFRSLKGKLRTWEAEHEAALPQEPPGLAKPMTPHGPKEVAAAKEGFMSA
jgi:hypothetical protein